MSLSHIIVALVVGTGIIGGYFVFDHVRNPPSFAPPSQGALGTTTETSGNLTDPKDVDLHPDQPSTKTQSAQEAESLSTIHSYSLDLRVLPLGDGKVSTAPRRGYVYTCSTSFDGGGALKKGEWIHGNTWDLTQKVSVQGSVMWPNAVFSAVLEGAWRLLSGNGLPVGSPTGIFPIAASDPAYQYDRNPNTISSRTVAYAISIEPSFATNISCVPMGVIGYALNGVAIYNALDAQGRDAVAHEVQDTCSGHPQEKGEYHYHGPSDCMPHANENNALVGYALDGFGIYSRFDANGREYTNDDLDACHGITSEILWNGKKMNMYHYVLTEEYPYTIGCFRGTPVNISHAGAAGGFEQGSTGSEGPPPSGGGTPPAAAISACTERGPGMACSFMTPSGLLSGTCKNTPDGSLACVP